MRVEMVAKTDPGRQRSRNEDNYLILEALNLAAVADGMGGHIDGDIASKIAIDTLKHIYENRYQQSLQDRAKEEIATHQENFLRQTVQEANKNIYIRNHGMSSLDGMGTTIVAVQVYADYVLTACVGDSRIYMAREEKFTQITQDHSLVEELVRFNIIQEKDILFHQNKNIITRALGMTENVLVDTNSHRILPNDIFLLCSDGLSDLLPDAKLAELVEKNRHDLPSLVNILVEEANIAGGTDNITVVLVKVCSDT